MKSIFKPEITYGKDTDAYESFIRYAKSIGLKVALLPRIESDSFFAPPFPYRADLEMRTQADWEAFYNNYEKMLLHYARLSQRTGVDLYILGLEYLTFVREHPDAWRRFIRSVRNVYKGQVTYSANWYEEYEAVTFWDALDYIGVGAYFELTPQMSPSIDALKAQWAPIVQNLETLSKKYNKPILFTEVGYMAFTDTAAFPWKWQALEGRTLNPQLQADCFQALFEVFGQQEWFKGFFIWRFYSSPDDAPLYDYSPLRKPAEQVVRAWYTKVQ